MTAHPKKIKSSLDKRVVDALIEATAGLLEKKSRADISVREIAQAAKVNPAMINYYFQTKSNLFLVFIEHLVDHKVAAMNTLAEDMEKIDPQEKNPTRELFFSVAHAFSHNASGLRLLAAEIQLNSELLHEYREHHASRVTKVLKHILTRLVERGIYRADLNVTFLAFTLTTMFSQHVLNNSIMKVAFDIDPDPATNAAWIDHMVMIFSPGLAAPGLPDSKRVFNSFY